MQLKIGWLKNDLFLLVQNFKDISSRLYFGGSIFHIRPLLQKIINFIDLVS
jgi:hypothetical protein